MIRYVHTNIIAKDCEKLINFYKEVFRCRSIGEKRDLHGEWLDKLTGVPGAHIIGEHLVMPGYEGHPTLEIFSYNQMNGDFHIRSTLFNCGHKKGCGIGTIGIIASSHVKKVIGVELNRDAVKDAITNAKRNKVNNIYFYNQDAGKFMNQMAKEKQSADVVFLGPPRSGSTEQFLDAMISMNPKKVVYISCNPVTLERDLLYLVKKGYQAKKAVPVDMFPGTEHVESIILMTYCGSEEK